MTKDAPLTTKSTIGTWLKHPVGGRLARELLARYGVDEKVLAPFRFLPLETAIALSGRTVPQSMVDELVARANRE